MVTKIHKILEESRKSSLPVKETMKLLDEVREQEKKLTDRVYLFFRDHLKDDQGLKDFARNHYNSFLSNDPEWDSFEDWYEESVYNMDAKYFVEGIKDWLGELCHKGKFDQFLEDIKFQDFIDNMEGDFLIELKYTDGSHPGDLYSMMISPAVYVCITCID